MSKKQQASEIAKSFMDDQIRIMRKHGGSSKLADDRYADVLRQRGANSRGLELLLRDDT